MLELNAYLEDQAIPAVAMMIDPEADGRQAAEDSGPSTGWATNLSATSSPSSSRPPVWTSQCSTSTHSEHGMAMRDPKFGTTIIAVAKTPHPMRQRSTLAHELAHVLFEDAGRPVSTTVNWSASNEVEERARAFARHLLIPQQGLPQTLSADMPFGEADSVAHRAALPGLSSAGVGRTPPAPHRPTWRCRGVGTDPHARPGDQVRLDGPIPASCRPIPTVPGPRSCCLPGPSAATGRGPRCGRDSQAARGHRRHHRPGIRARQGSFPIRSSPRTILCRWSP